MGEKIKLLALLITLHKFWIYSEYFWYESFTFGVCFDSFFFSVCFTKSTPLAAVFDCTYFQSPLDSRKENYRHLNLLEFPASRYLLGPRNL